MYYDLVDFSLATGFILKESTQKLKYNVSATDIETFRLYIKGDDFLMTFRTYLFDLNAEKEIYAI